MSTLDKIKTAIRASHDRLDEEIQDTIRAGELRMRMIGVQTVDEEDPVTLQALKCYARGAYNFQGDGERYMQAFEKMAIAMSLCGDYNGAGGCGHE